MLVLNFTHPLTADHLAQIEALAGPIDAVIEIPTHFDQKLEFAPQVTALADACNLTPAEWQTSPILIVPPALSFIAVALLAELHGRMGYFPSCVRLRPVAGSAPPRFEFAEILPLQDMRERARDLRR
jgi:hypothetical protein